MASEALTPSTPSAPATLEAVAWQAVGEMTLPDGRVERQYRVRFTNGPHPLSAVQAELVADEVGLEVVRARLDLGDLLPGAQVVPSGAISLRHAPDHHVDLVHLPWRWHEHRSPVARFGRLLGGPPGQLATQALRAFDGPSLAARPRLAAMLATGATAGDVNQVLQQAHLRIAAMRPGNHTLTLNLTVAGPGADPAQYALQVLTASPAFAQVQVLPAPPPAAGIPADGLDAEAAALHEAAADFACDD